MISKPEYPEQWNTGDFKLGLNLKIYCKVLLNTQIPASQQVNRVGDYYTSWQTMAGTLKPVMVYHITLENVLVICRNMNTEISNVFYDFYYEFMLSMIIHEHHL